MYNLLNSFGIFGNAFAVLCLFLFLALFLKAKAAKKQLLGNQFVEMIGSLKNISRCKMIKSKKEFNMKFKNINLVNIDKIKDTYGVDVRTDHNLMSINYKDNKELEELFRLIAIAKQV